MIEISHLTKQFGRLTAVSDLSMQLAPGEILGFLGPNGAGKSTTMKMIAGFLRPSQGEITIFGKDIDKDTIACQEMIGYLPEGAPCYEEMTPESFLDFIAEIRGYTGEEKLHRISDVIAKMSLQSVLGQRIETLSKGFKRRVGLAQAIIHDPKVLILDEPTDGLDPNQKHQVRELIRGLSKDKIVIISTHILEEVSAVCSRVVIISNGQLQADCTPTKLEQQSRYHGAITVSLAELASDDLLKTLGALPTVSDVQLNDKLLTVFPAGSSETLFVDVNHMLATKKVATISIFQERGRLDDVFRDVTLGDLRINSSASQEVSA